MKCRIKLRMKLRMKFMRKNMLYTLVIALMLMFAAMPVMPIRAETVAETVYETVYTKKINKLLGKSSGGVSYTMADVTGDGVPELLVEYKPSGRGGSGSTFKVFTLKEGKAKCILTDDEYGLFEVISYAKSNAKSNALVGHTAGHGGERYIYYKYTKKGKFTCVASKGRQSVTGGSAQNGAWAYFDGETNSITKKAFKAKIKKLQKGIKTVYSDWTWANQNNN